MTTKDSNEKSPRMLIVSYFPVNDCAHFCERELAVRLEDEDFSFFRSKGLTCDELGLG